MQIISKDSCEVWKSIPGHEGLYEASSFGRIKSLDKWVKCGPWDKKGDRLIPGRIKKTYLNSHNGYLYTGISRKTKAVHRLIAISFLDNKDHLPEVNHEDGDKTNNAAWNLKMCTRQYNCIHAHRTGLMKYDCFPKGINHHKAKLTNSDVIEIRKSKLTATELIKKYSVNRSTISHVRTRKGWKHL